MLTGHRTWLFENKPVILSSSAVGGPFESKGPLAEDFDLLHGDMWLGQDSFEKAQKVLLEESCQTTISKSGLNKEDIKFFIAGDLTNQITTTSFAARTLGTPYFGIFGACSTTAEGLALASFMVDKKGADYILTGSSSHNAVAERQFRYPTEYGAQKPATSQWTVTGAGTGIIADSSLGVKGPRVTSATIGRVVDMGLTDPMNMGGAMAPAAVDTIEAHLKERNIPASYYDLIVTGDLAHVGREISLDLFEKHGIDIDPERYKDCGILLYRDGQPVLAGGSGAGCSASVLYGHLLKNLREGTYKKILIVATGALLSPTSVQQNETIPCIAHAVSIEVEDSLHVGGEG